MSAAMSTVWLLIPLLITQVSSSVLPSMSLLQKSSSSPVNCHATGFYPNRARLFWTKHGVELHEGVEPGEILPNHDGTFQMSVKLDVSSIQPGDWGSYNCVFRFSDDADKSISIKLNRDEIKSNSRPSSKFPIGLVVGAIVGSLIIAIVFVGVWRYKQRFGRRQVIT
ncbi:hypothetical protein NL108_013539 [Boleophthalmus pectinirostris]|uniref:major histocompatibility complex class I-related gene protein-like n=1 Tax=Boleophthalmus pectinirostris TaxID=150288 RepID=UPI00242E5C55|nr:major histocompatibility complex class I-related gene protein-like [Boleophthalmus pectinirostris]KAJ0039452.1 hypothetical protein NL108_013539 [Boleophthalmus pectinirostris]